MVLRTHMHGVPVRLSPGEVDRLRKAHAKLAAFDLQPVIDEITCCIRAECPVCRAGANDPDGLYRPLATYCDHRHASPLVVCLHGCPASAIEAAFANGGRSPRAELVALRTELESVKGEVARWRALAATTSKEASAA